MSADAQPNPKQRPSSDGGLPTVGERNQAVGTLVSSGGAEATPGGQDCIMATAASFLVSGRLSGDLHLPAGLSINLLL